MKMNYIKIIVLVFSIISLISCDYTETDFGFDASVKGMIKDNGGNPLHGDLNSNTLVVKLLGENDEQPMEIRVAGDGTYQNLKMFPKKHEVWLEGPIVSSPRTTVDFDANPNQMIDFTVTPLISPKLNSATGSGTSITVNYSLSPNEGNTVKKKEVYVSTVKYPTAAIGSRTNVYFTKTTALPDLSGTVTVTGLEAGITYFVRIGAQAGSSALMNYSNQIEVKL